MAIEVARNHPILTIIGASAIVRVIFLFIFPTPDQLGGDFPFYDNISRLLLSGEGFGGELNIAPGWPFFLAVVYALFGGSGIAAVLGQAILGIALAASTYLFAGHFFNKKVAFVSGMIMGLWPASIMQMFDLSQGLLLYSNLLILGLLAFLISWERRSVFYAILSGVLFAAATLTESIGLYIPAVILLWAAIVFLIQKIYFRRDVTIKNILIVIVFIFVFIAGILPWVYRNNVVFGEGRDKPFIAKEIERNFIRSDNIKQVLHPFSVSGFPTFVKGLGGTFLVPHKLNLLDSNTEVIYKDVARDILLGRPANISSEENFVLWSKILLSVLHWVVLAFAVCGLILFNRTFSLKKFLLSGSILVLLTLLYTTFSSIGYGSLSNFSAISPLSGFFFPFLPFSVVFASYCILSFMASKVQTAKRHTFT